MSRTLLITLATGIAVAVTSEAQAVTWVHHDLTIDASWYGGDSIGGQSSFTLSQTRDVNNPTHYIQSWGMPVRVQVNVDDDVLDNPAPGSDIIQQKFHFSYNANTGVGNEVDTSTHTFDATVTDRFVFHTTGAILVDGGAATQLAPYSSRFVESGTYSAGVFTSTGTVLDLPSMSSLAIGPGFYRYTAAFASGPFDRNFGFSYANNSNIFVVGEAVPEPATLAAFGLGLAGLITRKRRNKK